MLSPLVPKLELVSSLFVASASTVPSSCQRMSTSEPGEASNALDFTSLVSAAGHFL